MNIIKKKLSLLISFILVLGSCQNAYSYYQGVQSMNSILNSYNIYYKNKFSQTYIILEKHQKQLLPIILNYDWNVTGARQLTKDKIIVYLTTSSTKVQKLTSESNSYMKYNLILIQKERN